jgi:tol-pal system protein YbgF
MKGDVEALDQGVIALEEDSASLRSELEDVHNKHAELRTMITDIRDQMRYLRGELEESQYHTRKRTAGQAKRGDLVARLKKSHRSNTDRIVRIEEYLGMEPSEKLVASDTPQEKAKAEDKEKDKSEVSEAPENLYAKAKQLFDKGEYENARELFRSFLKQYPKEKIAGNAQFWLGEIYYREKWYEKAILEYQKVIENHPKGNKTPSALLKQGFAFLSLDDKSNARLILKELVRKFPKSNEAKVARNKLKTLK